MLIWFVFCWPQLYHAFPKLSVQQRLDTIISKKCSFTRTNVVTRFVWNICGTLNFKCFFWTSELIKRLLVCHWSGRSEIQISDRSNWTQCCQWLATAVHFFETSCMASRRNDAEMGPANLLHALDSYSDYNEKFNLNEAFESPRLFDAKTFFHATVLLLEVLPTLSSLAPKTRCRRWEFKWKRLSAEWWGEAPKIPNVKPAA